MGLPISSANITNLEFSALIDISGATPSITLTNQSTVIHANKLNWWFVLTTPSGTYIHQGTNSSPDVALGTWSTWTIPANSWVPIFGTGGCAQVEFSSGVPYSITVNVEDIDITNPPYFSLTYTQVLTRPNGNTTESCGNFGTAYPDVNVQCDKTRLYCFDKTNYAYQTQVAPVSITNTWTLVYPPNSDGTIPDNGVATNTNYVFFPIGFNGDGYALYLMVFATYQMTSQITVKLQYKSNQNNRKATFGVWCGIDMCKYNCEIQKLFDLTKSQAGYLDNPEMDRKLYRCTTLFALITQAIMQPLCNIDIHDEMKKLEKELGMPEGAGCGCCGNGVNPGAISGDTPPPSGCCGLDDTLSVGNLTTRTAEFHSGNYLTNVGPGGIGVFDNGTNARIQYTGNLWQSINDNNKHETDINADGVTIFSTDSTDYNSASLKKGGLDVLKSDTSQAVSIAPDSVGISDPALGATELIAGTVLISNAVSGDGVAKDTANEIYTQDSSGFTRNLKGDTTLTADQIQTYPDDSGFFILKHVGSYSGSGSGASATYSTAHGLPYTPTMAIIVPQNDDTAQQIAGGYWVTVDATNIVLHLHTPVTTTTVQFAWMAIK